MSIKSVGFSIQKGGVGKTSIAVNTAFLLSKNRRALLIDGDPQGSTTSWLLTEPPKYELADLLQGKSTFQESLVKLNNNLSLIPTFGVEGELKSYSENALEKEPYIFEELKEKALENGFEIIIYDLSPGLGRLERCILIGCDEVITPLTPEYLSLDGVQIFAEFFNQVKKGFKRNIKYDKIVINMINKSFKRHEFYTEQIKKLGYKYFEIGQTKDIPESQTMHKSLLDFAPSNKVLQEFEHLARAIGGSNGV